MMNRLQIPEGVTDYYGDTAFQKRRCEGLLRKCFSLSGFDEVQTPTLEYYDTFRGEIGDTREEATIRFFDQDGRMLALRPDLTLPVARLVAATKLAEKAVSRYFYIGDVYGTQEEYGIKRRQFTQAGCELFGAGGPDADAEIILTAIRSVLSLGISDFVVDIGHVGFVRAVCVQAGIPDALMGRIGQLVDEKNEAALSALCQTHDISGTVCTQLVDLIYLFGEKEILSKARNAYPYPACEAILDHVERVIAIIESLKVPVCISVDLGMVPNINYYTGMVFRGLSPLLGHSILSGGRYDRLMEQFGRPVEASGFALGVENVLHVWNGGKEALVQDPVEYLIGGTVPEEVHQKMQQCLREGHRSMLSYQKTQEGLRQEMEACGIEKGYFIGPSGPVSLEKGGEGA